jgi:guanosine-3',5'-bis(diphosphate) 3'-pyrophosphohydrolase
MSAATTEILAREFVENAHGAQRYGDKPYVTHLRAVRAVLRDFGVTGDVAVAAWLHDVLEDTKTARDVLTHVFGKGVADLVWAVTGVGKTRKERNASVYAKLEASAGGRILKLADRIANAEASRTNVLMRRLYQSEHVAFKAAVFDGFNIAMWQRLDRALGVAA